MRATITSRARPSTIGSTTRSWSDGLLAFLLPSVPGTTKKSPRYRCSNMCTMLCLCEDLQAHSWWVLEMYWECVDTRSRACIPGTFTKVVFFLQADAMCLHTFSCDFSEFDSSRLRKGPLEARDTSSTPTQRHESHPRFSTHGNQLCNAT